MLSAEDFAAVKIAVQICCCPSLKKQILDVPEDSLKKEWGDNVEKTASLILETLGVKNRLQEKIIGFMLQIGIRMKNWVKYHERFLDLSPDFSVDFLKSSFFTSRGIIDNKKAAKELIKCKELKAKQRYKLACLYCFAKKIRVLFNQMSKKDQQEFFDAEEPENIKQPPLIKFWSYFVFDEIDKLIGGKTVTEYLLNFAVESGSKVAVEFFVEKIEIIKNVYFLMVVVEKCLQYYNVGRKNSWLVFRNSDYYSLDSWLPPICFYVDILCFLFPKLRIIQQLKLIRNDIEGNYFGIEPSEFSLIFSYFLEWPYQHHFMTIVNLTWEFLPLYNFVALLAQISNKIESDKGNFSYGVDKIFDYRKLLMEFWSSSPQRFKIFAFKYKETVIDYIDDDEDGFYEGNKLLENTPFWGILLLLNNFTNEDKRNVELILENASVEKRRDLILSNDGESICIELMKDCKWERLDLFMSICLSSQEQKNNFKRELCFSEKAKAVCLNFVNEQEWHAANSFIRWSSLSEKEINLLKKEVIISFQSEAKCQGLFLENENMEVAKRFFEWYFPSQDEFRDFKRHFIYSHIGLDICCILVFTGELEQADEFTRWCLPSEEIIEYKKNLAYSHECLEYIFAISRPDGVAQSENLEHEYRVTGCTNEFDGMWQQLEMFLTWCLSSDEEINEFIEKILHEENGSLILERFIRSGEWEEADAFLSWLDLTSDEMKNLKKKTIDEMFANVDRALLNFDLNVISYEVLHFCDKALQRN